MRRVEESLSGVRDRRAHFICALSLCWPAANGEELHCETFEGRFDGSLVWPPRGTNGFGYDPMFQPGGYDVTCGELDPDQKHRISHRAQSQKQKRRTPEKVVSIKPGNQRQGDTHKGSAHLLNSCHDQGLTTDLQLGLCRNVQSGGAFLFLFNFTATNIFNGFAGFLPYDSVSKRTIFRWSRLI